jgi:hypothetical protein
MNPDALRERKITVGDLKATQSVTVQFGAFYVISCFHIPLGEGAGYTFHSKGSTLAFADAAKLEDEAWRTQLAESHLRVMAQELRTMTDVAEAQLAKLATRVRLVDELHVEGLEQLERAAGAAK